MGYSTMTAKRIVCFNYVDSTFGIAQYEAITIYWHFHLLQ